MSNKNEIKALERVARELRDEDNVGENENIHVLKRVTFQRKPRTARASAVPGDDLLVLRASATTTDGRRVASGTTMRPLFVGNSGYTYTLMP